MFRFARIEYLFLLIPVLLLVAAFVYTSYQRKKNIKLWGNPALIASLMPNVSYLRPHIKFYSQLLAIILIVVMLAQPQFGTKEENVKKKGIEVMVALDVSNSMMAQDIQPSRLDKAKQILSKLVDGMSNDKIGLIVFAGDAYIQLPITTDYVSAKMFLSSINTQMVPRQGTAIGSAIDMAIKSFGPKSTASRAIIVITDGENHEDDAVAAAKLAAENGIKIYVVGMGKPEGAPIPIGGTMSFKKDKEGNVVVSKLNEEMCNSIAQAGKGIYVRADNTNSALRTVSKELDKLAKADIETKIYSQYNEQFQSFAFIALILLVVDTFIFNRKNKQLSRINIFGEN
ncbi:von Willebrand factor type A [uncultured Paludibacter sp.]|uniref:von Willebrand factor type A n=1 Tax=uncultured Paludibacter sp. TaxID=497635 RepID=A0A653ABC1_9BACT|nr:von Willebrand factor type A [uncultured Paludibacter sp.]